MPDATHNPNCDGEHCTRADGEVRRYPLLGADGSNWLLCRDCFDAENNYRAEMQRIEKRPMPHVDWETAERYPDATGI